ncbi:sulfotransferase domain-containing protein [Cytobacillus firmus]|uniref:sulfotransferase domain-containing protein n=1 Tax=Cytobacillus firmus TaxID=1399 RepID=UPI001C96DB19|nr:sulfotransferase domain-containing protein [Cytobacillus firmus]MBY6053357.1 sulfotransferase domain-containing protein [Cytobacillus firmus]USK41230.1 sulfotransferase domain-containing protein [Cytobacillus firmus]
MADFSPELPRLFVNSVPKAGTHLIVQIVKGIPNIYQERYYRGGHSNEAVLALKPGEMLFSHLPYEKSFAEKMKLLDIKQIFIYRDLRDVAISLVHFINEKLLEHPLYKVFKLRNLNFEEQLNTVILGVNLEGEEKIHSWKLEDDHFPGIVEEFQPIYKWKDEPAICSVRYERLIDPFLRDQEILKIIDYLWGNIQILDLDKQELLHLMKNNIAPEKSWTFRKGTSGNWKTEFTESNKLNFKKAAGSLLVDMGYERDFNW